MEMIFPRIFGANRAASPARVFIDASWASLLSLLSAC